MTKLNLVLTCATVGIGSSLTFAASPVLAFSTVTVPFNTTGTSPTRSFNSTTGGFTLTFAPSVSSPQSFVSSNAASGLCVYAQTNGSFNTTSSNSFAPCGLNGASTTSPLIYNNLKLTANKSLLFSGGVIGQIVTTSDSDNVAAGNIIISNSLGGPVLGSIAPALGTFTFITPIALNQGQELIFTGTGTNVGLRFTSFEVGDAPVPVPVPGPLPLLGAAAAFGWSRKLRKRLKLVD